MSEQFPRFQEYLNSRGKVIEKGIVNTTGDCIDVPAPPKAKEDPRKANKTKDKQPQVKEYINQQGQIMKPVVEPVADYHGPDPKSPPKSITKGKGWETSSANSGGENVPYRAPNSGSKTNKTETGFADIGDKRLIYNPEIKAGNSPLVPGGTSASSGWDKNTKTEQFIDKTKNMSFAEFSDHMLAECGFMGKGMGQGMEMHDDEDSLPMITSYTSGKFHPAPPEAIKYVVVLADKNERVLENLIHSMKERGMIGKLMKSLMSHNETFDNLNDLLEDEEEGPQRCCQLTKAMDGKYSKFMQDREDMYESVGPPMADLDDEDEPIEPPEGDDEDYPDEIGDEDLEASPEEDMGEEDPEADIENDMEDMEDEKPKKKRRKRFAHHNMLDAMSGIEHMRKAMRSY